MTAGAPDSAATATGLYRLAAWLSPNYPVGAYSFSHGLEAAVAAGDLPDAGTLQDWLTTLVRDGAGQSDAVLLAHAYDAAGDSARLAEVHALGVAFQPSAELALESQAQGRAFLGTTRDAWPCPTLDDLAELADGPVAYPVAVGAAAGGHGVARAAALTLYVSTFAGNLVSAALRLGIVGQRAGQRILAGLAPTVEATVAAAPTTPLADLATATPMADLRAIAHERQTTRLFRS